MGEAGVRVTEWAVLATFQRPDGSIFYSTPLLGMVSGDVTLQ